MPDIYHYICCQISVSDFTLLLFLQLFFKIVFQIRVNLLLGSIVFQNSSGKLPAQQFFLSVFGSGRRVCYDVLVRVVVVQIVPVSMLHSSDSCNAMVIGSLWPPAPAPPQSLVCECWSKAGTETDKHANTCGTHSYIMKFSNF